MENITTINPTTISICRNHQKLGGHKYATWVVTKAIQDGHEEDMLSRRFHDGHLKVIIFSTN